MQQQPQSTLDVIYENWRGYQEKLSGCVTPLTDAQLLLQPAAYVAAGANCTAHYCCAGGMV